MDKNLCQVNDLEMEETNYKLGVLKFDGARKIVVEMSVWVNSEEGISPVLGN